VAADLRGDLLGAAAHLKSDWALWAAILVPPLAWASDLTISYALVKWACHHHTTISIEALTGATLVVIVAAGVAGWSADRARSARTEEDRARFMAMLGALTTILFLVLTIAMAITKVALRNVCV
jgi:hypothetical protein